MDHVSGYGIGEFKLYFCNYLDFLTLTPDVQVIKLYMKMLENSIVKLLFEVFNPKIMRAHRYVCILCLHPQSAIV